MLSILLAIYSMMFPLLLCAISFCALHTHVSYDILIFIERFPNCSWSGPRNIIMEIWRHRVSQTIPKCLWPQVWQLLFQKFCTVNEAWSFYSPGSVHGIPYCEPGREEPVRWPPARHNSQVSKNYGVKSKISILTLGEFKELKKLDLFKMRSVSFTMFQKCFC